MSATNMPGSKGRKGKNINIPPELPEILKQFTKDAIRTQPADLIEWATLYFSALIQGQALPVKDNLEKATAPKAMDLSPPSLTALHTQLGKSSKVTKKQLEETWKSCGLSPDLLKHILSVGSFGSEIEWIKFFALGCSYLGGTIKNAMIHACYILNADSSLQPPDACVPLDTFHFIYTYLAGVDGEVSKTQMERAIAQLETLAKENGGMVKVSDFINSRKIRLG
ncbi:ropporin-1-like [Engraulis encrasicolus]|uniref:ropporin-1-like n=1 Tax=Engraulis encrasicolus TaxID=184585 RepID=UPI002FD7167C